MSQKRVVIIFLSDAGRAAELAGHFDDGAHEPLIPQNTDEFYRLVNSQCVELVIIDNHLPGFLSGIEILERLQRDLLHPTTVLIAIASVALQQKIKELPIASVIRPTAGIEEIVDIARAAAKAGKIAQVPVAPEARRIVQAADGIKPLPQILVKYASQLDSDSCSTAELAQDIAVDPKMTSMLLKLMNSSALAVRQKITRVSDAVNFLGVRRTVAMILSGSLAQSQTKLSKTLPEPLRAWYHNRSVLIASVAKAFARFRGDSSPDTAYVLGLLQELGISILAQAYGETYLDQIRRAREVALLRLEVSESQELGITHADVSAALLQKWELPQSLVRLVVNHHQPEADSELSAAERKFLHLMRVGEAVANLSDVKTPQRHQIMTQMLTEYEMGSPDEWKACLAEAVVNAVDAARLLSIPVPDESFLQNMVGQFAIEYSETGADSPTEAAPLSATVQPPASLPPAPAPATVVDDRPETQARQLLVIDDEPEITKMITLMLRSEGISICSCADPEQAAELSHSASAILCDVHLGKFLGIDIVRSLRQNGFSGPVIMMSGDRTRSTVKGSIEAGINDYLTKPFDRQMLLSRVVRHMQSA